MSDIEFVIHRDNRNDRQRGENARRRNVKEDQARAFRIQKRKDQQEEGKDEVVIQEILDEENLMSGKKRRERAPDEPFVEINPKLGKPSKKMEKNMRRQ